MKALLLVAALAGVAHADTAIMARGEVLFRRTGKQEVVVAKLPPGKPAKAVVVDPTGALALVDLGTWHAVRLDADKPGTPLALPCAAGSTVRFADDGSGIVVCSGAAGVTLSVDPRTGKAETLAVPAVARVAGGRLVWADPSGVWIAPASDVKARTRVAPEPPRRAFSPNPDGTRAVGVYTDFIREHRVKQPADTLMLFSLDGEGARRKGIRDGVPVAWSRDGQYVLVQDGATACLMRATGGQYKCWKGFRGVALSASGTHALIMQRRSLYRADLEGAFTMDPDVVARDLDAAGYAP